MLTAEELEKALSKTEYSWHELSWDTNEDFALEVPPTTPSTVKVNVYESKTAGEGDWSADIYIVLQVEDEDGNYKYFRKTGHYQSYEGSTWDGTLTEVHPATKSVTVWTETNEYDSFGNYNSFD